MVADPATITEALIKLGPAARVRFDEIDKWTREERVAVALLPCLMNAACSPYNLQDVRLKDVVSGVDLVPALENLHRRTVAVLSPGAPFGCNTKTISAFRTRGVQTGYPLAALFLFWLSERIAAKKLVASSRVYSYLSIVNFVSAVEAFVRSGTPLPRFNIGTPNEPLLSVQLAPPSPASEEIARDERIVSQAFGRLMGLDRLAPDIVMDDFFDRDPNKACFVVYRRAALSTDVLKGFLVVQPPKTSDNDAFSFNHFYADRVGNRRETRGFLLSLAHRHYFVGATGKLRDKKAASPTKRPALNEGMKFLVLDRKMQAQHGSMWGGLFLSHDRDFTPIAGRCILIRSKFEHSNDVSIGPVKDLKSDIQTNCDVPGSLDEHMPGILLAIDNSYEPSLAKGGNRALMGPLTIVPPIARDA